MPNERQSGRAHRDFLRGVVSSLSMLVYPLGTLFRGTLRKYRSPERLEQGLILVLPGMESQSFVNQSVAWGLIDAGVSSAIEIYDWTTGCTLLMFYHLQGYRRNLQQARNIAQRIVDYQADYPGRPVHLIGHSAGGALTILALEALPVDCKISGVVLLAGCLSPQFNLAPALRHVTQGIWNFCSRGDWLLLGLGTLLMGTVDRRHTMSAGAVGFREPEHLTDDERALYAQRLHHQPSQLKMARDFNLGGHFGACNRVFVKEWIAPLLVSRPAE